MKTLGLALALGFSSAAFADDSISLDLTGTHSGHCPASIAVTHQSRYYEGGAEISGTIKISSLVTRTGFYDSDKDSVTWFGQLKPAYANCKGRARETFDGVAANFPALSAVYGNGYVYIKLNMKTLPSEAEILNQNIDANKNPVFKFAIAD